MDTLRNASPGLLMRRRRGNARADCSAGGAGRGQGGEIRSWVELGGCPKAARQQFAPLFQAEGTSVNFDLGIVRTSYMCFSLQKKTRGQSASSHPIRLAVSTSHFNWTTPLHSVSPAIGRFQLAWLRTAQQRKAALKLQSWHRGNRARQQAWSRWGWPPSLFCVAQQGIRKQLGF